MSDNYDKSAHGVNGQKSLDNLITYLKSKNYIKNYQSKVYMGYPEKEEQFYFQFLIEFADNSIWILHSTTSIRDRIHIQQWHSEHMKKINNSIEKAFVVYPDTLEEKELYIAVAYNKKINDNKIYSAIDGVLNQTEIYNLIEEYALQSGNTGSAKAIMGLNFENRIAETLNNSFNFIKWKTGNELETGLFYSNFEKIVNKIGLSSTKIKSLSATSDDKLIGMLPTRGKPKTDIILTVKNIDNSVERFTFSCKRSSSDWVSVHQYSAQSFCEVLKITDTKLIKALSDFQLAGALSAFGAENVEYLTNSLVPYRKELALWVYGGINGYGDPKTHWAQYMITYNNNDDQCDIKTIEEYIEAVEKSGVQGHFGTIFNWTYASGQKGKSIQLKGKVI